MTQFIASTNMDNVACAGVRGVQQMRRARSEVRLVGKKKQMPFGSKPQLKTQGVEADTLLRSLLDFSVKNHHHIHGLSYKSKEAKEIVASAAPAAKSKAQLTHLSKENQDASHNGSYRRFYFGKVIQSYDEFYNIVASDDDIFDDQYVANTNIIRCEPRYYFGKEVSFYDEFCNLVGDAEPIFDDEVTGATHASCVACRYFYCREIETYEDFYCTAGASEQFDDEVDCV